MDKIGEEVGNALIKLMTWYRCPDIIISDWLIHTLVHRLKHVCSTPEFLAKEKKSPSQSPVRQPLPCTVLLTKQTPMENQQKPNLSIGKFIEGARVVIPYIKASVNSTDTP